ncbi:MAG: hypothetical protein K8T90_21095 [Planctomycetes bacterium]|nr:hypothetical protein [Planctomycetota bacterium]
MNRVSGSGRWKSRALWAAVGVAAAAGSPDALAAGTVTVDITGGTLTITGDDADNALDIFITQNALYISPTSNTALTGPFNIPLSTVTNIVLRLGGGNDYVSAYGAAVTGNITVDAGSGNDDVTLDGFSGAVLDVKAGDGTDTMTVRNGTFSGGGTLDPGAGAGAATLSALQFGGDLNVDARLASGGTTRVDLLAVTVAGRTVMRAGNTSGLASTHTGCSFAGRFSFLGGSQQDELQSNGSAFALGFDVRGGAENDTLQVFCQSTGAASSIKGDAGDDAIEWSAATTDARRLPKVNISLNSGAGNDSVRAVANGGVASGSVKIVTGGGDDVVQVANLSAPTVAVAQGGGADTCSVFRLNITGKSTFNGGGARDEIRGAADPGHTFGKKPKVTAYESKVPLGT